MPETFSIERRKVLKVFGANLILTEGAAAIAGFEGTEAIKEHLEKKEEENK